MENIINEYTLKSNLGRIVTLFMQFNQQISMCDPMSFCREDVVAKLWCWTYGDWTCDKENKYCSFSDYIKLIDILKADYGPESIEELSDVRFSYTLKLPNSTWYLRKTNESEFNISCIVDSISLSTRFRAPYKTVAFMKSFDHYIPQMHDWIDEIIAEKAKENLLCDITSATSKAIIEEVIAEEGLITPKIISVKGTHKGRVIVRFETGDELNCAQNYLRSQLIRRFKPGFRRKR